MGGHKNEGYGLYGAPTEGIWLMLGHQVKLYGLCKGTKLKGYGLYWALLKGIWLMVGHQVKGYGLWEAQN